MDIDKDSKEWLVDKLELYIQSLLVTDLNTVIGNQEYLELTQLVDRIKGDILVSNDFNIILNFLRQEEV